MRTVKSFLALGLAVLGSACGGDDGGGGTGGGAAAGGGDSAELRLATYNGGLAVGFVDYAEERAPVTTTALAELPVDVLCVQEFWREDHVDALEAATKSALPSAQFLEPMPETSGDPACKEGELDELEACVVANCDGVDPGMLAGCVLQNCNPEYSSLPNPCKTCLGANVGKSLEEVLAACESGAEAYAYGGAFGIGLLTSAEVVAKDAKVFESTLNRRAVLWAHVRKQGFGEAHVFCTHLSAVFDDIDYPGEGSWEGEQAAQIDALRAWADEKAGGDGIAILLGDMNTGPAVGSSVGAEVPANYEKLAAGYANPFVESTSVACTFCADNPLVGGADDDESVLIDHILVKGFEGTASAERVMTDEITIEAGGKKITTAYSDHYGVRVTLKP